MHIRPVTPLMLLSLLAPLAGNALAQQPAGKNGGTASTAPVSPAAATAVRARQIGSLNFTSCTLKARPMPGLPPASTAALCSTLSVPENPDKPDGRRISLQLSWVPAAGKGAADDPLVLLAGGPGQSARESWPTLSTMLGRFPANRPVLLIDQRGTGESNPLHCVSADGRRLIDLDPQQTETLIASCPLQLADKADVRFYTTPDAVRDIETVRQALGLKQLNLLGISHGTRVAQQYARLHPQHVRLMVLDAPVPNNRSLMEGAPQVYRVLDQIFGLCQADAQCSQIAPNPAVQMNQALRQLRDKPVTVRAPDPLTGRMGSHRLDDDVLGTTIRMLAYTTQTAQMLPGLIAQVSSGQYDQAAQLGSYLNTSMSQMIPMGTYYAATCGEDFGERPLPPHMGTDPLRINALLQSMQKGCTKWPQAPLPKGFHEPLKGSIPTLVLSGEWDPILPPGYGDEIVKNLSNARHIVLRRQGHSVIASGCMPKIVDRFLHKPDAAALDTGCLETR